MPSIRMKLKYKLFGCLIIAILASIFFKIGSTYNSIKSAYFQLKLIDSFERGGDWGKDGGNYKDFFIDVNLNYINNAKSGIFSWFYVTVIELDNPTYRKIVDKMNSNTHRSEILNNSDLKKKLKDGLGSAVDIDLSKQR